MKNFSSILEVNEVTKIFKVFNDHQKNCIFAVGGCIRDIFLEKTITDIDFATSLEPDEIIELLNSNNISFLDIGIDFGTITAIINDKKFEITTFRKDTETDGRHTKVLYSKSIDEDVLRRDFTINAMYLGGNGDLFDPLEGQKDIEGRNVRFIGNPDKRIKEDYLRILRYFRFLALLDESEPDEAIIEIIKSNIDGLSVVSKERRWDELKAILNLPNPSIAISSMSKIGLMDKYFNCTNINAAFSNLLEIESRIGINPNPILRLSLLASNSLENANDFIKDLPLSKSDSVELLKLCNINKKVVSYISMKEVRYLLYSLGRDEFQKQILVRWAVDTKNKNEVNWRSLYEVSQSWTKPIFDISARDVINMGISQGPIVGEILKDVEDWWAENDFIDDKFSLIERLKAIVQSKK
ncbi:MAG: hypothetical protein CMP35_00360 [Rickettsiales bacterium]|nr:hypothetical protein [Rickettsiales bacterium]